MSTPTTETAPVADCRVFTPEQLAAYWNQGADGPWTPASIRALCRDRRIPSKKISPKLWIIPAAALADWAMDGNECVVPPGNSNGDVRASSRPYRVEVRSDKR